MGEGAEINLLEKLKEEFRGDKITRVKKGEPGADIRHEVINEQESCGLILYDSKNRNAWRNDYVEKLRSDQLAEKANCAVLSTRVFPAGASQVHLQSDVIVVNPARALAIATLLRSQIIQMHTRNLSDQQREEKMTQIYAFITSDRFTQLLRRLDELTDELLDLDVREQKWHKNMWSKRGTTEKSLQRAHAQLSSEVDRIISQGSSSNTVELG